MKLYKIYVKKSGKEIEDVILINDGFEIKAALFTFIYTLYHKMWKPSIIMILLVGLAILLNKEISYIVIIGVMLLSGLNFSIWYEKKIKKDKGVEFWGRTVGKNRNEARMKFFEEINK